MNHNTILITRKLNSGDMAALRQKLRELYPGEEWTIIFGEMATVEPEAVVGPSEYKVQDHTPVPEFGE